MGIEQKINYQLNKYPAVKKVIKRAYQTGMYAISKKIKSEGNITRISPDDSQHEYFFGYYDKSPWDISDRYMLCMKANDTWSDVSPREKADILLIDTFKPETDRNRVKKVAETRAWNVQQACMLQWLGPDFSSRILYNDYRDGKYVAIILTLETMEEKVIPAAVYSVSSDGKFALTLDFSRLYELRPGYGYYNVPERTKGVALPDSTAIWKVDLETGEVTDLLKYTDFANFQPRPEMKETGAVHKVNHIMLSPNGKRFMVLYRWFNGQRKYTRLITCNTDGADMYILSDDDMVSHCFWKNNTSILAFENKKKGGPGYYLMKDKTDKYIHCWPQFSNDGHPSYSPDGKHIITDSYPDRARVASINLMDGNERKKENITIARVFAPFKYDNDTRCDLHPRWNHSGDKICFDSVFEGHRGLYVIELNNLKSEKQDRISVVVATYNGSRYLEKQLNSIATQTMLPDEIVICDDCSTDNTIEIAESFATRMKDMVSVKIYQNKENLKFTWNFLTGVSNCTGDIIFLCDQDDEWDKRKIEVMANIMKDNTSIFSLSCAFDLINEEGRPLFNKYSRKQKLDGSIENVSWKEFIKTTNYPGMSMAIRRQVHDWVIKTVYGEVPAHDWLYNEVASKKSGMYKVNMVLTHYRQHSNNVVGTVTDSKKESLKNSRMHSVDFYEATHKFLLEKYKSDKSVRNKMEKLLIIDGKRRDYLSKNSIISCFFTCIESANNLPFRTFLGDGLAIIKNWF